MPAILRPPAALGGHHDLIGLDDDHVFVRGQQVIGDDGLHRERAPDGEFGDDAIGGANGNPWTVLAADRFRRSAPDAAPAGRLPRVRVRRRGRPDGRGAAHPNRAPLAHPSPHAAGGRVVFELVPALAEAEHQMPGRLRVELFDRQPGTVGGDGDARVTAGSVERALGQPQETQKRTGRDDQRRRSNGRQSSPPHGLDAPSTTRLRPPIISVSASGLRRIQPSIGMMPGP